MNRRGNRFAGRSTARPARPMDWVCAQVDARLAPGSIACAWIHDPIETLETFTDPTLMATRQFTIMRQESTQNAGLSGFAAMGIIAWDGVSAAAPTECPGPLSDCDFDWVVRVVGIVIAGAPAGSLLNPNVFDNTHLSKARRRLPSQTGLLIAFETDADNTGVVAFGTDVRCLLKE